MGGRFDSDVRSKDHLKPRKKDGPGPGDYKLPGAFNIVAPRKDKTSWGKSNRFTFNKDKHNPLESD